MNFIYYTFHYIILNSKQQKTYQQPMQVNIMIPLFVVPQEAAHYRIMEEIKKILGFQQINLFEMGPQVNSQFKKKQNYNKTLCVQVKSMNITIPQIAMVFQKVGQLQRQNDMLKKDLSNLFLKYKDLLKYKQQNVNIKQKLKQNKINQTKNIQKTQNKSRDDNSIEKHEQIISQQEQQIEQYKDCIKKLVSQKRSKQQIIQKLTVYCQHLLKIIENKKISIF